MKLFTGWALSAGLVVAASAANAQIPAPNDVGRARYQAASDVAEPYGGMPPGAFPPPHYGYEPALLPPQEVYAVLRENGFSPLGIPRQRGYVYVIAVLDRAGEDGRLFIDGRNGRILRFVPAFRMGPGFRMGGYHDEDYPPPPPYGATSPRPYGPAGPAPYGAVPPGVGPGAAARAMPPMADVRGAPRPPDAAPRVASRTVPLPAPKPESAVKPAPAPMQQSAAVQAKPADGPAAPPPAAAPTVAQAKPTPSIQPTQEMPRVQGLE